MEIRGRTAWDESAVDAWLCTAAKAATCRFATTLRLTLRLRPSANRHIAYSCLGIDQARSPYSQVLGSISEESAHDARLPDPSPEDHHHTADPTGRPPTRGLGELDTKIPGVPAYPEAANTAVARCLRQAGVRTQRSSRTRSRYGIVASDLVVSRRRRPYAVE